MASIVNVAEAHDQRSPLVQRGLEIPIWVMVTVELGRNNVQVTKRYAELVNEHLKEPVNGLFDDVTTSVLKTLVSDESESDVEVAGKRLFEGC